MDLFEADKSDPNYIFMAAMATTNKIYIEFRL